MSMYEKEWECCGDVTITKSWQPKKCPFCTTPPSKSWVSLTDKEIDYIWGVTKPDYEDLFDFPRAIEAKLKEKNHAI